MPESNPYPLGGVPAMGLESSGLKFTKGKLESNGRTLIGEGDKLATFAGRTGGISLGWLGYGVSGRQCDSAHEEARGQQVETLKTAQKVLESWREAFKIADAKYVDADDQSTPNPYANNQMPQMPGLNGSGLNGSGLNGLNMPNGGIGPAGLRNPDMPNLQDPNLRNPDMPNPNLQDPNLRNPDMPNPNLQDPNLRDPNLRNPNLQDPNLRNPDMPNPNLQNPNLQNPNLRNPDLQNPDLRSPNIDRPDLPTTDPSKLGMDGLPNSTKTDLAGLDPSALQNSQPRVPDGLPLADPARVTNGVPGGGTATSPGATTGTSNGMTPTSATAGLPKLPTGAAMGGMGGMPMVPMMPMSPGQNQEGDTSGSGLLRGEPEDWEDEEGVGPAVLRHEGA